MIKILSSNFLFNFINKNIKNFKTNYNTRFAPEISGYSHLGHIKNIIINIDIARIYNGKCNLRIDDTNPEKNKKLYKKYFIKDLKWFNKIFKKKFLKNIFYTSKNFHKLYQYLEFYKKKKNIFLIRKIKSGYKKEKKKIIKINKIIIYRIKYNKHYKTNYNWIIFPMYNWANVLLDKIENINYSICSIEFLENKKIYNIIKKIIYKKINPIQIESSKFLIKNYITSKRLILQLIKNKYIKNYYDSRLITIGSLKNNFFNKKKIYLFLKKNNITKKKSIIYNQILKNLKKINYKNLKKIFVQNYISLKILNYKKLIFFKTKTNGFFLSNNILIEKKNFIFFLKNNIFLLKNFKKNINLKNLKNLICKNYIKKNGVIKIIKCKYTKNIKKKIKENWINNKYKNKIILIKKNELIKKNKKNILFNTKSIKKEIFFLENLILNNLLKIKFIKLDNKIIFLKKKINKKNKILFKFII